MNFNKLISACIATAMLASCQNASDPYMTLETKTLTLEAEGGSASVKLTSNVYYRVNNDCSDLTGENYWANIVDTKTDGDVTTFLFEVAANESTSPRTGTVRFIGDDVTPLKLTLTQKGMVPKGVNPTESSVGSGETSASFKVFGDRAWTASCEDADVKVNPASGIGDGEVTLTFPANESLKERTIKVNVAMEGDKTYTFTLVQSGYRGVLADWDLNAMIGETSKTFVDEKDQTEFPGTNGKYLDASSGNGRIEYYACDRTGYAKSKYSCTRGVGGNGDPYVSGTIPGDYWLVTASLGGKTIPAGTKIHYYFVTKMGTATSAYWMLEYKNGDAWTPVSKTMQKDESATKGLTGNEVSYSQTITYNFAALLLDAKKNGAYVAVDGTFTTEKDMDAVVLRFAPAGHLGLDGSKNNGLYIDRTEAGGQTRFSAQKPSKEDGTAVKEYDQHVIIEIAE